MKFDEKMTSTFMVRVEIALCKKLVKFRNSSIPSSSSSSSSSTVVVVVVVVVGAAVA
jgi:hypothetical protein